MRLICTINPENSEENPLEFSFYLTAQGIENQCEEVESTHTPSYRIWVYDEDQVEKALTFYANYQKNPKDPLFRSTLKKIAENPPLDESIPDELQNVSAPRRRPILSPSPYGFVSILTLVAVIGIFFWAQFTRTDIIPPKIPGVIPAPVFSPIERTLVFDYPPYFAMRDHLLTLYTRKDIDEKIPPSAAALALIHKMQLTPTWMGIYDQVVFHFQNKPIPVAYNGPLFGDLKKGQLWRLFTPALLHFDLLHIFFNVLWFILLGNQIEYRIGWLKFSALMLVVGILSNITQYLMSGPFFMGLSGIVCGMAGFIWARQQIAPWEGYLLHRFTLIFLGVFVVGMFLLSLIFFFMQIFGSFDLSVGIANTAHLTGGLTGYCLGRAKRLFSIKKEGKQG